MRSPFSLYKKNFKSGPIWYARFLDPATNEYTVSRSTGIKCTGKKGREKEALLIAGEMAKEICFEKIVESPEPKPIMLIDYLEAFWKEDSHYAKYKRLSENSPLSIAYIELNASGIRIHIKPYYPFKKLKMADLKPVMIEDWKIWMLERGVSARRVNAVMQTMSVPIRYAFNREEVDHDPFLRIKKVVGKPKEKGVLKQSEVDKLINTHEDDARVSLAILLAVLAGLRRGEVRGLRWGDIDYKNGLIDVQNNYVDTEGAKGCKWQSERKTLLPTAVLPFLKEVKALSPCTGKDDYILFSLAKKKEPFSTHIIRNGFPRMLKNSGIPRKEQKERNLTYHGMRHTFITLARMAGIPDITVQALAGHKSSEMMDIYSHAGQVIDFAQARQMMDMVSNDLEKESGNE